MTKNYFFMTKNDKIRKTSTGQKNQISLQISKVLFAAKLSAKTRKTVETRFVERVFGLGGNEM